MRKYDLAPAFGPVSCAPQRPRACSTAAKSVDVPLFWDPRIHSRGQQPPTDAASHVRRPAPPGPASAAGPPPPPDPPSLGRYAPDPQHAHQARTHRVSGRIITTPLPLWAVLGLARAYVATRMSFIK